MHEQFRWRVYQAAEAKGWAHWRAESPNNPSVVAWAEFFGDPGDKRVYWGVFKVSKTEQTRQIIQEFFESEDIQAGIEEAKKKAEAVALSVQKRPNR